MEKPTRVASIGEIPLYAIQNRCPHQNADFADGYIRNNQVYCPMHNWAFDIKTGAFAFNPGQKIKTYPVEIRNNEIFILYDSHIRQLC